jgi:hypothetical protein
MAIGNAWKTLMVQDYLLFIGHMQEKRLRVAVHAYRKRYGDQNGYRTRKTLTSTA